MGVIDIISILLGIAVGIIAGYFVRKNIYESKIGQANSEADRIIKQAEDDSKRIHKEKLLEAQEEIHKLRTESERENKERRSDLQKFERRVIQKEEILDKKLHNLEQKETSLGDKLKNVARKEEEIEAIKAQQLEKLESISGITSDKAKEIILTNAERDVRREMSIMIKEIESQAKEEAEKKSREIIGYAIQKCAADHVAETTVTVVNLPNDEMKGRIIGREGRNIRTLETLTGIDLIIDDTPEAVILSGFDPIRREVARIALEKLIADGRIHPARIEEMVEKARKEVDNIIKEYGEQAAFETGVHGIHPELIKLLGRLNYRTSYGQNVLKHSIEVAHIAGIMAAEIGADIRLAKRAGLLHDIGKAVDHEMEGTHVEIGMDLLKRYKESKEVVHAMSTHHGDYEPQTIEAVLVTAADAISAARPGARRETLEAYIRRLEKLEEIANSYEGVDKSFAIQAGREIRIMVKPENVSDEDIHLLARDMTKRIEDELEYPGQIKVSIIRETRAIEYAK
ncbi:MAG TPA: ribonuclease Y [Romboutsia timonensis]|uniref:Ribonuclease Y n=1 Tax=Romboutsia timonensis TaxID=1776391 RepID=A0A921T057_9FIRM|nr:ribonuclease Y [uncultured Romboutsia sp.]HJG97182.1 ribonuclease Y [Romboutsia timonensis]